MLLHRAKQLIRDFFSLSKSEQYGIIVLLTLIVIGSLLYFVLPALVKTKPEFVDREFVEKVRAFNQKQQYISDSIEIERVQSSGQLNEELARQRLHPFPFDPNMLPEKLWQKLGLTKKQIRVIKNYEAKGGKFYCKEDLKKLYCISEAEYNVLEPYISIKSNFSMQGDEKVRKKRPKVKFSFTEINSADTALLNKNLNLPFWLANRVVAYRKKLGGYYSKKQLLEVYGMKEKYYNKISRYVVVDTSLVTKLCVNQLGFKQLLKHPYCNYELTKKIFNARNNAGGSFTNRSELIKIIDNDPAGLKLLHYLYICPSDLRDN